MAIYKSDILASFRFREFRDINSGVISLKTVLKGKGLVSKETEYIEKKRCQKLRPGLC